MLTNNKKGLSEMVAYVILIMIAISLSLVVYTWMQKNVLRPVVKCDGDVSLVVDSYLCSNYQINLTVKNQGNFNVDGFYIKAGNGTTVAAYPLKAVGSTMIAGEYLFPKALGPGETGNILFDYTSLEFADKIEIQAFQIKDKKIVACSDAVIKQELTNCN